MVQTPEPLCSPPRFNVYDSDTYAPPARYLLPSRLGSSSPRGLLLPGSTGRWQLPEDLTEMQHLARMTFRVQRMCKSYVSAGGGEGACASHT